MKNAEELESAVKNLNYYANKIQQLSTDQFEYDVRNCEMIIDATKRLDCLGAIGGNCEEIKLLCVSIKVNIENAKKIKLPIEAKEEQ